MAAMWVVTGKKGCVVRSLIGKDSELVQELPVGARLRAVESNVLRDGTDRLRNATSMVVFFSSFF